MRALASAAVTALVALAPVAPRAQMPEPFPSKPVHIVVGVGAGGLIDTFIRLLADPLQRQLGQPVIVENKLGSGGMIGARAVAEADPDGYTLVAASPGTFRRHCFTIHRLILRQTLRRSLWSSRAAR